MGFRKHSSGACVKQAPVNPELGGFATLVCVPHMKHRIVLNSTQEAEIQWAMWPKAAEAPQSAAADSQTFYDTVSNWPHFVPPHSPHCLPIPSPSRPRTPLAHERSAFPRIPPAPRRADDQIFAVTDPLAERVRKISGATLRWMHHLTGCSASK